MPQSATAVDVRAFLEALDYGADQLTETKTAVSTAREAWVSAREAAMSPTPDSSAEDALRRATAFYLLSRPEKTLEALASADEVPQATLLRGRASLELCDPSAAVNAFASLVNSSVDGTTLLLDLATAAALSGDTALAQKAAAKLPDGPDVLYAEGIALESDGEYADARARYEDALRKDPNHRRSLFRLAHRLDTEGQDARARELYQRLVSLSPTYTNALINLALLYEDEGRFAESEKCHRKVLESDPHNVHALVGLKDVLASQTMFFDEDHERREDRRAQVLRTPITEFELSVRSRNCLAKMNIESLGDLVRKTEGELLAYKNFGETSLQEIKDILAQKGLRLGMSSEDDAPLYSTSRADAEAQLDALFGGMPPMEEAPAPKVPGFPAEVPATEDPYTLPIASLDLSIRARRCMENLELETVGDLLERTEADLLSSKNFGQTSLNELRRKLEALGLALRKK